MGHPKIRIDFESFPQLCDGTIAVVCVQKYPATDWPAQEASAGPVAPPVELRNCIVGQGN